MSKVINMKNAKKSSQSKQNNRKVTQADKEKAIKAIKHTEDNFNVPNALSAKDVHLVTEYISHAGNIERKTKSATKNARERARKLLGRPAKIIDTVRVMLPAINSLQSDIVANQNAANILSRTLQNHGYKKDDFLKAANQEGKKAKKMYQKRINQFKKNYMKKHSGKKSDK